MSEVLPRVNDAHLLVSLNPLKEVLDICTTGSISEDKAPILKSPYGGQSCKETKSGLVVR